MHQVKNNKGSTLVTAVIVLLIALALITAMQLIKGSYEMRSYNQVSRRQAYLYAKSTCNTLAEYLIKYKSKNEWYVSQVGDSKDVNIESLKIGNEQINALEFNSVKITRTGENTMTYRVTAVYRKQSQTVKLTCNYNSKNNSWSIGKYS